MKLSFNKTDLLKGINISLKAVPSITTMDLLKCVLINATASKIMFLSNDNEMAIETVVQGTVLKPGSVALDAKIFFEIIRKLPDEEIKISVNERFIANIKCGQAEFNIPGQDPYEYPYPPEIDNGFSISLSQFSLKEMIRKTIFSLNLAENNKLMTGEMFEIKNNVFRIVSLDGHRVAIRKLSLSGNYENTKVVVPGKALNEISKILSDNVDDTVKIFFSENNIVFSFDDTVVYSRLIDGDYFQIDNMISKEYLTKITVDKKEFIGCIERAGLFVKEGENKPIILNITDSNMELSVTSPMGSMNENLYIEKEGDDLRIGFNPKFLTDALKVIDDEKITMYLLNRRAPGFIKDEDESYLYLILPINIL